MRGVAAPLVGVVGAGGNWLGRADGRAGRVGEKDVVVDEDAVVVVVVVVADAVADAVAAAAVAVAAGAVAGIGGPNEITGPPPAVAV